MSAIHQGSSDTTNGGGAEAVPARYVGVSITLRRRVKLARVRLRQFLVQPPLVALPTKLINSGLGNGLSFILGQAQAQPTDNVP